METRVPGYENTSNIREWPSEIGSEGPMLRNLKKLFAYSVGVQLQGSLLNAASSATTIDGSVRKHRKLDNSGIPISGARTELAPQLA